MTETIQRKRVEILVDQPLVGPWWASPLCRRLPDGGLADGGLV